MNLISRKNSYTICFIQANEGAVSVIWCEFNPLRTTDADVRPEVFFHNRYFEIFLLTTWKYILMEATQPYLFFRALSNSVDFISFAWSQKFDPPYMEFLTRADFLKSDIAKCTGPLPFTTHRFHHRCNRSTFLRTVRTADVF